MEIKIGHVYYTEVGIFRAEKDARDEWCGTMVFSDGTVIGTHIISEDALKEIDPSVWHKAVKLHDVYMNSLKSLIEGNK